MPINPETVQPGVTLHHQRKTVVVAAVNRFWTRARRLIGGTVILEGDATKAEPRNLIAFCKAAKRPR